MNDSMFMGKFTAMTLVSFIVIVLMCTLITLPIAWNLPRQIIWHYREQIFFVLILPKIWQPLQNKILKKFLYGKNYIIHPALASIFTFWQVWLSFLAGIVGSLVRFGFALVGIIAAMPQLFGACTPEVFNQRIYTFDE